MCFLLVMGIICLGAHSIDQFLQSDPAVYEGQAVEIRGFLYVSPSHQLILAAQPDLKSCCVGSTAKIAHQILVKGNGDLEPRERAVTLRGRFRVEPLYQADGDLKQLYVLEDSEVISKESFPLMLILVIGVFLMMVGYEFNRRQRMAK